MGEGTPTPQKKKKKKYKKKYYAIDLTKRVQRNINVKRNIDFFKYKKKTFKVPLDASRGVADSVLYNNTYN